MGAEFETFEHTADIGLRVRGDSWSEVLMAAAEGMYHIQFEPPQRPDAEEAQHVEVRADGRDELLRAWLRELLFLLEVRHFMMARCEFEQLDATHCQATAFGHIIDLEGVETGPEIKAVTYHGLSVVESDDGFLAEVVFDI